MKFNRIASFGLVALLTTVTCEENQTVNDTRAKVQTSVQPSASVITAPSASAAPEPEEYCPSDMVKVPGIVCIDRYEASLYGMEGEGWASPFYYPNHHHIKDHFKLYTEGDANAEIAPPTTKFKMGIPKPPAWQLDGVFKVKAIPIDGQIPSAYMSGIVAENVCKNAGKRLCTEVEWVMACKGENNTKFPYGDEYQEGVCNIAQQGWAPLILHGETVEYLDDPRLNLIPVGKPFLEKTGSRPKCVSIWGGDAIYDMVGNLQEWIDDQNGVFTGGFSNLPSLPNNEGCDEKETGHKRPYYDYSLGTRCCSNLFSEPQPYKDLPVPELRIESVEPKIVCHPKDVVLTGVDVVPREEWAPLPANLWTLGNMNKCNNYPIQKITLHHTGDSVITKPGEGRRRAGGSVFFHINSKGWGDIAYHYLVTPNGEILEGRNPAFRSDSNTAYYPEQNRSHTPENHLVITLVGNFEKEEQELTMEARSALTDLLRSSLEYNKLSVDDIILHKDIARTLCPGQQVTNWFNNQSKSDLASQPTTLPSSVPHLLPPDSPYPQPLSPDGSGDPHNPPPQKHQ